MDQTALTWGTELPVSDYTAVRLNETTNWWEFIMSGGYASMALPTSMNPPRFIGPNFPQGIFYGNPTTRLIAHTSGGAPPVDGEKGDICWNNEPSSPGNVGWVCIAPGNWIPFGMI